MSEPSADSVEHELTLIGAGLTIFEGIALIVAAAGTYLELPIVALVGTIAASGAGIARLVLDVGQPEEETPDVPALTGMPGFVARYFDAVERVPIFDKIVMNDSALKGEFESLGALLRTSGWFPSFGLLPIGNAVSARYRSALLGRLAFSAEEVEEMFK